MKKFIAIGTLAAMLGCGLTAKQVTNAVFSAEQAACMADAASAQDLSGEPQVIAAAIMGVCTIAQPLLQDVVNYVNSLGAVKAFKANREAKARK